MMDTVEVRVARGADWLDAVYPEWWTRIDVGRLDLSNGCRCVLGQIGGQDAEHSGYHRITEIACEAGLDDYRWAFIHGFNAAIADPKRDQEIAALDEAWISEIKARWERGL